MVQAWKALGNGLLCWVWVQKLLGELHDKSGPVWVWVELAKTWACSAAGKACWVHLGQGLWPVVFG